VTTTLHFKLKVPSKDTASLIEATSIKFSFRGLMRLEDGCLYIEWTGSAKRETAGIFDVEVADVPLPLESFELPLQEIRLFRLSRSWFRTRVTLSASTLDGLVVIPSEEDGVVHFWIARVDRPIAERLIAEALSNRHE
jgi:hypothetical protein